MNCDDDYTAQEFVDFINNLNFYGSDEIEATIESKEEINKKFKKLKKKKLFLCF